MLRLQKEPKQLEPSSSREIFLFPLLPMSVWSRWCRNRLAKRSLTNILPCAGQIRAFAENTLLGFWQVRAEDSASFRQHSEVQQKQGLGSMMLNSSAFHLHLSASSAASSPRSMNSSPTS